MVDQHADDSFVRGDLAAERRLERREDRDGDVLTDGTAQGVGVAERVLDPAGDPALELVAARRDRQYG